jgi:hypothetical protein
MTASWSRYGWLRFVGLFFPILLFAIIAQWFGGGFASDLNLPDESSHYINGLLIHDYVAQGFTGNPIAYAIQYYIHFPKVAIGHWPPFFYVVEAIAFFIGGPSPTVALLLQAIVASGLAALVGIVIGRFGGWLAAGAASITTLAAPEILFGLNHVMLDGPFALLALLATLAWARYMTVETWAWSTAFALLAVAAVMTKGNGFFLAFVPTLSIFFCKRLKLLRDWHFWLPAPIVALLTVPWYLATYKITADGFNYSWGLAFTAQAIVANGGFLLHLTGIPGLVLAFVGAAQVLRRRDWGWECAVGGSVLSVVIGGFAFHCLVPVAIDPRYLTALIPGLVILAFFGIDWIVRSIVHDHRAIVTASCFLLIVAGESVLTVKVSRQMPSASAVIFGATQDNPFILVGSSPGGEGAIIADIATRDRARAHYVVRGLKVLGSGNFMGSDYRPRFTEPAEVQRWVEENGIGWVVIDTSRSSLEWTHNRQLLDVVEGNPPGWTLIGRFAQSNGETLVYRVASSFNGNFDRTELLKELAPGKVIGR